MKYFYIFEIMNEDNKISKEAYINHPKHFVAIDCVIFGYKNEELKLLIYPRSFEPSKGNWSLLGGFVQDFESSDQAATRILKKTTGLDNIYLEQVAAFTEPEREQVARVISIGYYALIRIEEQDEAKVRKYGAEWFPLNKKPELIFDHNEIVEKALIKLQQKAIYQLVGPELLSEMFTLTQLRKLYEAIFQRILDPGNFRKKILSLNILKRSNKKDSSESKKGAYLYSYIEKNAQEKGIGRIVNVE